MPEITESLANLKGILSTKHRGVRDSYVEVRSADVIAECVAVGPTDDKVVKALRLGSELGKPVVSILAQDCFHLVDSYEAKLKE